MLKEEFTSHPITVLLSVTDDCNLRCSYCYHSDKGYSKDRMTIDFLEELYPKFSNYSQIKFIWHGGEPLLMSPDFYEEELSLQKELIPSVDVSNALQTNGTLLTREHLDVFTKYKLCPGLSYDGMMNEETRGNTKQVIAAMDLLRDYKMPVSILHVVSEKNYRMLEEDYECYKSMGVNVKFNQLFTVNGLVNNVPVGIFDSIEKTFLKWFYDTECNIKVGTFEEYINSYYGIHTYCIYSSCLTKIIGIDSTGVIRPCNRNYPLKYYYGNVRDYDYIEEMFHSKGFIKLIEGSIERRKKCKISCRYYTMCQGGCNNDAILDGSLMDNDGLSCRFTKRMFKCVEENLKSNREFNRYINHCIKSKKNDPFISLDY